MLSMYKQTVPPLISSMKMSFLIVWKVAGLFFRPKNIARGSNSPWFMQKVAFHLSPSHIWKLLYPHQALGLVKYCTPLRDWMRLSTRGSGYLFFTVMELRKQ